MGTTAENITTTPLSASTEQNLASEEEKKKFLEALRRAFKKLAKFFSSLGRASIVQQMKEMQEALEVSMAQNSVTSDTVEDLYELVNDMEGKLETITPETAEKILEEFQKGAKEILELPTANVNDIKVGLMAALKDNGAEVNDSLDNVRIINPDDNDKNHFFIEVDGEIFEAKAEVKTVDGKPDVKINVDGCDETYLDIFTEDGELKEGFSYVPKVDGNPEHELVVAVCKANDLKYTFDLDKELERQLKNLPPKGLFLKSRMDKICRSEDGRYESKYFASDASFHVRDTKTGDMIRFKSLPDEIKMYLYRDTKDLNALGSTKEYKLGSWKDNCDGTLSARVSFDDAGVSALLHCDEAEKWLEFNGIKQHHLEQAYHHDTDTAWQKVESKEGRQRVAALKNACEKALETDDFVVRLDNKKDNQFTFLNISPKLKEGQNVKDLPRLSFTFDKDGNPQTINYKAEKGKNKFVYNLSKNNLTREFKEFRYNDDFATMYNIAYDAIDNLGIQAGMIRIGDKLDTRNLDEGLLERAVAEFDYVPEDKRNLNMGSEYDKALLAYDKDTADIINKAALYAIANKKISTAQVQHLLDCNKDKANSVLSKLEQLGVVSEGIRTYEAKMTEPDYVKLITSLASDYSSRAMFIDNSRSDVGRDSFAAFLVDSYSKTLDERFAEQKEANHKEVVSALTAVGDALHVNKSTIYDNDIQHSVGSYNQTIAATKILEKMGVISKDNHTKPRDILCSEDELKRIFKEFDEPAYKEFENKTKSFDEYKKEVAKEKTEKAKSNKKQEGIEQD